MTLLRELPNQKNIWGRSNEELNEGCKDFFSDKSWKNHPNKTVRQVMECQHDFHDEMPTEHKEHEFVMAYCCEKCPLFISISGNRREYFSRKIEI